jgi:putative colanic acid biosynthesis UDP-glucose lipid carrier transferase
MPACGGTISDLRRWLNSHDVDQIVFSYVSRSDLSMQDLIRFFGDTCIPVVYAPTWVVPGMSFKAQNVGGQPCIDLWQPLDSVLDRQLKRCFDLAVAGTALVVLSPLLLLIALAIRLTSPGPVLFLQDRYGLDGSRFRIYKFRTMRALEADDEKGLRQATRHDPRITPVGAVLRRWSLDELPQLLNVLQGHMSLVGPRPHAVDHNEQYRKLIPGYMQRHLFKPGITGLAQVNGFRGETATLQAMAHRVAADLDYQREWSLARDLKILIKTVLNIRSPNAY